MLTAVVCLTANIYYESRGEPAVGQAAVANVTMNRAHHDPKQVCDVVTKEKQFSWTNSVLRHVLGKTYILKQFEPRNLRAWVRARNIAVLALSGRFADFTKGATFYHTKAVKPLWDRSLRLVMVIGQHKFYKCNKSELTNIGRTERDYFEISS